MIKPGVKVRKVFLPAGDWVHLWSGKSFRGGESYSVPAVPGWPPVFYRPYGSFAALFRETGERFAK